MKMFLVFIALGLWCFLLWACVWYGMFSPLERQRLREIHAEKPLPRERSCS